MALFFKSVVILLALTKDLLRGALNVAVFVVGNGTGELSSNSKRSCLCFLSCSYLCEKRKSICSPLQLWVNCWQNGFFSLNKAGEEKNWKNSGFKPASLHLKIGLVSHINCGWRIGYINAYHDQIFFSLWCYHIYKSRIINYLRKLVAV